MPQVMHIRLEETTLFELEGNTGGLQPAQDSVEVFGVLLVRSVENDNIVEIYETCMPSYAGQDDIQCPLEGDECPFESERHTQMAKRTHMRGERGLTRSSGATGICQ